MKTARERAVDVVLGVMGNGFSRETFLVMANDRSDTGALIRKWVDAVEAGVEQDRREIAAMGKPS
jgi:hypothetical protein